MSIEGSLALAGLLLVAVGVAVSVRRTMSSPTANERAVSSVPGAASVDQSAITTPPDRNVVGMVLLVVGVVALLAAGVFVAAKWTLFSMLF